MGEIPKIRKFGTKLTIYSIIVALIPVVILGVVSSHTITQTMNEQAQDKINTDLYAAEEFMGHNLDKLSSICEYTVNSPDLLENMKNKNIKNLKNILLLTKKSSDADFVTLFDNTGNVVLRSNNNNYGDKELSDHIKKVLNGSNVTATIILDENTVKKENLENKTIIYIFDKGDFVPLDMENKSIEYRGLALVSIKPIYDNNTGEIMGALMISKVLNKDTYIVDKIKATTKDTSTIFLGGLRISTNVQENHERAMGTFVSQNVYEQVIKKGEIYYGRAFVVDDWYLTAYKPIKDDNNNIIGMIYVGVPEKPFIALQDKIKHIILWVGLVAFLMALVVSVIINSTITRPIKKLKKGVEMMGKGDYNFRVNINSNDEFEELAHAFNKMADEIKSSQEKLKKQAEKLEISYNELKKLDKFKSEIISIVSHELRTPLTSIKGYVELVLDGTMGTINESQKRCLEIANENIDRLKRLIDNMLDLSKIERGELKMDISKVNLNDIVQNVVHSLKPLADGKNIKIINKVEPITANLDKDKITGVLTNLIENAIKFSPVNENVTIEAFKENNMVHITVKDNGPGIPKSELTKIFDIFYQVNSSAKRIKSGSGLGLAICKSIVESHGGKIWVESKFGKESTFHILLPLDK
ncbi:cache domain-containing protein [Methanococcus aeolicus]|uniref:cache domain-containing protein n=1 Tax=Methanococcus aeolicus TaxID=42879 RepID=UPI0021C8F990|nr:cache domain-containing protein [Methanococcus aeolicus]UXM85010.1 cache domain-containing protein [Methanococcus aeolicus]